MGRATGGDGSAPAAGVATGLPAASSGRRQKIDRESMEKQIPFTELLKKLERAGVELTSKKLEGIIVNNIVLGNKRSDFYYGPSGGFGSRRTRGENWNDPGPVDVGPDSALEGIGKYGEWRDIVNPDVENPVASEGDNAFLYSKQKFFSKFFPNFALQAV